MIPLVTSQLVGYNKDFEVICYPWLPMIFLVTSQLVGYNKDFEGL